MALVLILPAFARASEKSENIVCFHPKDTSSFNVDSVIWVGVPFKGSKSFHRAEVELEVSLPSGNVTLRDSDCTILNWTAQKKIEAPINLSCLVRRYFYETADTSGVIFDAKNQTKNFLMIKHFWKKGSLLVKK
jgi:hypothetical protein